MKLLAWLLTVAGIASATAAIVIFIQLLHEVDSRVLLAAILTTASVAAFVVGERLWQ